MPEINENYIKTIKIVTNKDEEIEFPANYYNKISERRGIMTGNDGMFAVHVPNGKKVLTIVSCTDDEIADELSKAINEVLDKTINN
jgi:hypothetical protein